jgi:large subunit ribosomal protein L25
MSADVVVEVGRRTAFGKNACRRLRASGAVPAVVYGLDRPAVPIVVPPRRIEEILKLESGKNTLLKLALAKEQLQREVMIREIQRHPVTGRIVHVDFVRVDLTKKVTVHVPIRLVGTPVGVKNEGGIVDFIHRTVAAQCLPTDIPECFEVDISEVHLNQHVVVGDIRPGTGVEILETAETVIAVVTPPKAEAAAAAEAAPAPAEPVEPELIKKGKEAEPTEPAKPRDE